MGTMIKDWMLNSERGQCCVYSWLNYEYLFGLGERIPVPFRAKVESGGGIEI